MEGCPNGLNEPKIDKIEIFSGAKFKIVKVFIMVKPSPLA